jgi:hypothetical protein
MAHAFAFTAEWNTLLPLVFPEGKIEPSVSVHYLAPIICGARSLDE